MKILNVNDFCSGIDTVQKKLYALEEQMKQIQKDVDTIISLEESFKGAGGKAIRSFYRECHRTFLFFYQEFSTSYKQTLRNVIQALRAFESAGDGYIKEEFLEGKVEQGLENIKSVTEDLTIEANGMMDKVSDIVNLTKLNDDEVLKNIDSAKNKRDETIKNLNEFDSDQTKALHSVEQDIMTMKNYIQQMESMFQSGDITIQEFSKKQFTKEEAFNDLKERLNQKLYENVFDHCQNPFLSKKEFNRIKDGAVKKVQVIDEYAVEKSDISGTYYQMKNGLIVREYYEKGIHYQIVDKIPKERVSSIRELDSFVEGTPLAPLEYINPSSGAKKLVVGLVKKQSKPIKFKGNLDKLKNFSIPNILRKPAFEGIVHDVKKADVPKKKTKETISRAERSGTKGIDNPSVTNKSNLYRGDSLLHSPTRPNGIGKPHISSSGDLVPASKDGLYKGRQVTVIEHILGGYRKGAKSNSPYTSFTNNKNVIGNYGENSIELDISALRKDIQSGKVKDVVILSPKQIQKLIERDVISSDFWKNRAINWTKRDNEYLIKGEVPSQYIKVSSKE
ncbi:hypothetical protein J2S13_001035 [Oikeobacillus pervagus]|uniref:LXG domain-containing protein n=1 Tax=Oikeobacillus pervagus TaxID=1325931 RepID=A0AAJ1WIQ0_9BACI|nr:LXG domain-containing protein [Oikeobacillus pervagus]MDQ0214638.1 hypothetical protein [Oikeobacillus pervagus]